MKAPLTSNSITERVVFTGLYIPEPTWDARATVAEAPEPAQPAPQPELRAERLEA